MRTIELKWTCRDCDTKHILGRHKTCPTCGAPRERGEMEMDGLSSSDYTNGYNNAPTVTDPELLDLANAGYDWFCKHCDSGNRGDGHTCVKCGSPRNEVDPEPSTYQEPPPPASSWKCFTCGASLSSHEDVCSRCNHSQDNESEPPPPRPRSPVPAIAGAALAAIALGFLAWGLTTHDHKGVITNTSWVHTTTIYRWVPTKVDGWYFNTYETDGRMPFNGVGEVPDMHLIAGTCHPEHYSNEQYLCGHHEDCHPVYRTKSESYSCSHTQSYTCGETCSHNGNGFATCHPKSCTRSVPGTCTRSVQVFDHNECHTVPDYCTRPVFKDKCTYTTHDWALVDTLVKQGSTDPVWADVNLGALEKQVRKGVYTVSGTYDGKYPWTVNPETETAFLNWKAGGTVTVHVRNFGSVSGVDLR